MAVHSTCSFKHSLQIFEHLILPFKFSRNLAILALNLKLLSFLPKIISCQPIVGFPRFFDTEKIIIIIILGVPRISLNNLGSFKVWIKMT
jgi:hypothetical protein